MNKQLDRLLSLLSSPQPSLSQIQSLLTTLPSSSFTTSQQRSHTTFFISHIYYSLLNNIPKSQSLLQSLLTQSLTDKQQVECLARLAFISIFNNRLKAGKYYHDKAATIINEALDNQKKSLVYVMFWVYSGMNNPGPANPYSNFVLSYIEEGKNNYEQAAILLKKVMKQESKIDPSFVRWRLNYLSQPHMKGSRQCEQYQQDNQIYTSTLQIFNGVVQQSQVRDGESEKKRVLLHLRTVYNKYYNNEEYGQMLIFLHEQISHLETDEIPLSLTDSFPTMAGSKTTNEIRLLPSPMTMTSSQFVIPPTTSAIQPNPRPPRPPFQQSLMNSTQFVIPQPTPIFNPQTNTNSINLNKTSNNYTPPASHNFHSMNLSNVYTRPPIGWIGSELVKLNYTTDGQKIKFFYIGDPSKKRLYYCERKDKPDTKFDSFYDLHNITDVKEGKVTKAFIRKSSVRYDEELSFSIILTNKTRDFIALNLQDYNYWIYTLKRFLARNNGDVSMEQSRTMSPTSISPQKYGSLNMSRKF